MKRRVIRLTGLLILLIGAFVADVATGTVRIPLGEVMRTLLFQHAGDPTWQYIIENIRIPKAFTAVLAGCALSVSGLQMQTLFRNPLADPSVLGITSGANLGVAAVLLGGGSMATLYAIKELGVSGSWLIIGAAFVGAAAVMLLVLALSYRIKDNVVMLIVGMMIGMITLSVISIWQFFSAPELIKDYLLWTFGSLGGVSGPQLYILGGTVFAGLCIAFLSAKLLDALMLGENYARSMGLSPRRTRLIIICSTSLMSGSITAFCGPIGFIGIAVPHIVRPLFNTSDHRTLIPACCLTGTLLMLFCDIIAQAPGTQTVLPINVITALVGAPAVIWIILRRNTIKSF